jgi:Zn-dependent protease with chaperone function/tetratricopeptide (TPR) repeat protein
MVLPLVLFSICWFVSTLTNLAVGWKTWRLANGSGWRLLWVCAVLGLLGSLPLLVWIVAAAFWNSSLDEAATIWWAVLAGMTLLSVCFITNAVQPPVRIVGTKDRLPLVTDAVFLERVAELARAVGAPVPVVWLWPSISGSQQAQAVAGTLPAPQIAVTDGILHRLAARERDAVVAHELAHIANGSLWLLQAVLPVSCAATAAVALFLPDTPPLVWGLLLFVGLKRLVSRPIEIDCDRRAARAMAFRETARALSKIHAASPLRQRGFLPLLLHALSTHPSREVRLWALHTAAPPDDAPDVPIDVHTIRWHRLTTACAVAGWFALVVGVPWAARLRHGAAIWTAVLLAGALLPLALIILAHWRQLRLNRRRLRSRRRWFGKFLLAAFLFGVAWLVLGSPKSSDRIPGMPAPPMMIIPQLIILFTVLVSMLYLLRINRGAKHRLRVHNAIQVHDFPRAIKTAEADPRQTAQDDLTRYNLAVARAAAGDRARAIDDLQKLCRDRPRFQLPRLLLGNLLLAAERPADALDIAREAAALLPDDPVPHAIAARAFHQLGQFDDAQQACDHAAALAPEDGSLPALAALLACDRGDLPHARELVARAQELSPGDSYVVVIQAEIDSHTLPPEEAQAAAAAALKLVESNPLVFLDAEKSRLRQKLPAEPAPEGESIWL